MIPAALSAVCMVMAFASFGDGSRGTAPHWLMGALIFGVMIWI